MGGRCEDELCVDEKQDGPDLSWSCEKRPREPDTGSPSWCSLSYQHQTLLCETQRNTESKHLVKV